MKKLQESHRLDLVSAGDIAREIAKKDSEIKEMINRGELIPDAKILGALENRIKNVSKDHGFILDGFPRTLKQASEIEKFLFRIGKKIDKAIYLHVPEEELVRRISKRYFCPKCSYVSRSEEKVCPECGTETERRPDDRPKVALERIALYLEKTIPVIQHYKSQGNLLEINGDQKVDEVANDILDKLKKSEQ